MSPSPPPVPVVSSGRTDVAVRRGARHDGWWRSHDSDRAIAVAFRLRQLRADAGKAHERFTIAAPLTDVFSAEDLSRAECGGITHILTQPWLYYGLADADISPKIDGLERYRRDFGL